MLTVQGSSSKESSSEPLSVIIIKRLFLPLIIKALGYLLIVVGIFLAIKDKEFALNLVKIGVAVLIAGWVILLGFKKDKVVNSAFPFSFISSLFLEFLLYFDHFSATPGRERFSRIVNLIKVL